MQPVLHDDRWPGKPLELATQKSTPALALDEGAHIGTVEIRPVKSAHVPTQSRGGSPSGSLAPGSPAWKFGNAKPAPVKSTVSAARWVNEVACARD